jgi:hypothetical protein
VTALFLRLEAAAALEMLHLDSPRALWALPCSYKCAESVRGLHSAIPMPSILDAAPQSDWACLDMGLARAEQPAPAAKICTLTASSSSRPGQALQATRSPRDAGCKECTLAS